MKKINLVHSIIPFTFFTSSHPLSHIPFQSLSCILEDAFKLNFNHSIYANGTKWYDPEPMVPSLITLLSAQPKIIHKLLLKFVAHNFIF